MTPPLTRYQSPDKRFPTTRWSVVNKACGESGIGSDLESLQSICVSYWYPLYVWARHSGWNEDEGKDLIQSFFERLIEKGFLERADSEKGKLRTFLLTCLKRHAKDKRAKEHAARRDSAKTLSLDFEWAEGRYHEHATSEGSPDALYDRRWAHTLIHYTLETLGSEMDAADRKHIFDALKPYLEFQADEQDSYDRLSKELNMSKSALKSQVFRLRKRFHDILLEQVSMTLQDSENPKDELMALMASV
ncbi:RNA polymerase sigma factor [Haloferula sp.]|uniref:RNA polymerase sigma factor n=1 Tax=Haloferula sp. TaxID=2497595 RepID=UPI003C7534DA